MELAPGITISGRYRVRTRAWRSSASEVWLAHDAVLERAVFIQTFEGATAEAVGRVVARTAQLTHPGVCQIYDVVTDPPGIVFEHAPGGRLADRKDGALAPAAAARMVCQLSSAIAALHEHGIAHGSISPATVLFDEESRPKLAGAAVATELGEDDAPDAYRPVPDAASAEDRDRYALAAVAYRLFTGREPGPDAPPARSAKRTVPPAVDALLSRGLARNAAHRPAPEEFRRVLDPIAAADEPLERGPGFFRQEMRWLLPVVLVLGLGAAAIIIGVKTDTIHFGGSEEPTASPTASLSPFAVAQVDDFDPKPGGNGEEHSEQARFAVDGTTSKGWNTVGYNSAGLGALKKGVGLLFDLGPEARSVGRIVVTTSLQGWRAEWRVSDSKGTTADDFETVTTFDAGGGPTVISPARRGRYWLLWITRLADNGSGSNIPFQAQVSEVEFFAS